MLYFFLSLILFLIFLAYMVIALSFIIKCRTELESAEYILKKTIMRKANFLLGLSETIENKDRVLELESALRSSSDISDSIALSDAITLYLKSVDMDASSRVECDMIDKSILAYITEYNKSVEDFNRKVFSPWVRTLSKACKLKNAKKA